MAEFPLISPDYSLVMTPKYETYIHGYGGPVEQRISRNENPQWSFKLNWQLLDTTDANSIMDFFIARKGKFEAFYFANAEEAYGPKVWEASKSYSVGDIVRPSVATGRSYIITTGGTSGGSEPTWPTTPGGTVGDNGMTWKENSYLVRFDTDAINKDYFAYRLYRLHEVVFLQVSA